MSESTAQIYLITGTNRGIGLALVADVVSKYSNAIVYAGVRNPASSDASKIKELAAKYAGRIEVVKYVSGDKEGNDALAKLIGDKHGRVDTVIANAAIGKSMQTIHETPASMFQDHFAINVVGPIVLFQSIRNLLKASTLPRFIPISSGAGSIGLIGTLPIDGGAYATSKAALNWVTRKIHFENEWLVSFPLCPGPVETDMAQGSIDQDKTGKSAVLKDMWRPVNAAASILIDIIAASTREKDGGQFNNIDGETYLW